VHAVISVGMLSEGWDAKTVTHIMGLRAFTSQLLCEQVVVPRLAPHLLRCESRHRLFLPEYVNIFGVPSLSCPRGDEDALPPPTTATHSQNFQCLAERRDLAISLPNIIRIDQNTGRN